MGAKAPEDFKHTTLTTRPESVVGITLLDEEPGFIGIYLRDENGGLWPARTVSRDPPEHHLSVIAAWWMQPGIHEDKRTFLP